MVERERALADDAPFGQATSQKIVEHEQRRGRLRAIRTFVYGVVVAVVALFALALINNPSP
jgi:multisubunit Na+/H+ antiporter MnhB subunit